MTERKTLLEFPCEFTIKAFGKPGVEFEGEVISIINQHVSKLSEGAVKTNDSKSKKYLCMSITFTAESQQQLDNIYQKLSASPLVVMAL